MFIQTEETPNPATLKFLPGTTVIASGNIEFRSLDEAGQSPLAQALFSVKGVAGVFLAEEFISITKEEANDWQLMKPSLLGVIMEHFTAQRPVLLDNQDNHVLDLGTEPDDEIVSQIKELLYTRVRPAVAQDGGDIVFENFEDGVVTLQMRGACAGCPSSTATLKMGVENLLRHYIPEVKEVVASGI
ncbi:MAG: NifU family protein [Rhodospirillaceae bacterium]|nr:NifU family protein [Rhodospirillaceae bacterium]|tara:strand:+ start:1403 stop:1963 length:561 start_codon:yes stop_codon:yes gene_type:complete